MDLMQRRRELMKSDNINKAIVIGPNSYIPINDLIPNDDDWVFEGVFAQIKRTRDYYTPIFGAPCTSGSIANNAWTLRQYYSFASRLLAYCNSTGYIDIMDIPVDGVFRSFTMSKDGITIDGVPYVFGNRQQGAAQTAALRFGQSNLTVGWRFFKAYHNGVLLYDLVPQEDKVTGKLGFYNKVTDIYYFSGNNYQPIWYDDYIKQ